MRGKNRRKLNYCKRIMTMVLAMVVCINTVKLDAFASEIEPTVITQEISVTESGQIENVLTSTALEEAIVETETVENQAVAGGVTLSVSGNDASAIKEETVEEAVTSEEVNVTTENADGSVLDNKEEVIVEVENTDTANEDVAEPILEDLYEAEGYSVVFNIQSYWEGAYNAVITISNTGTETIENWYLKFPFSQTIMNMWNAEMEQTEDGNYVIHNLGWNQDIPVGGTVNFGFGVQGNMGVFPEKYELIGAVVNTATEDYTVDYEMFSDWGTGFNGQFVITNASNQVIEDWILEFDFDRTIDNLWNGTIESHEGNHYVVKNAGYNANISAGQSISFGFLGQSGTTSDTPQNIVLHSFGINNNTSVNPDTDGDGIPDEEEIRWGLNHLQADSDGDGLSDAEELNITLTDPLNVDTDGNGILDGADDMDGDGIDNHTEISNGTNPLSADSDGDNLTDYEEIYFHGSNPLQEDSDEDGLNDYDEVHLGFHPLWIDTDGDGVIDSDEKQQQIVEAVFDDDGRSITKVSVSMNVTGNAQKSVGISNTYGMDKLSSDVVGLVGVPVEIHSRVGFDTAEITFYYDETELGDVKEENLAVLWYDEVNNWYQILDQDSVVDTINNKVSYVTTHFSTYMLVDRQAWYDAWRENIDYRNSADGEEKQYFDIAFVVDVSGSMDGERISTAKAAMQHFVDSLQEEDEAAIVKFNMNGYVVCDFTDDTDQLKSGINSLRAVGGTMMKYGLQKALELYADRDSEREKIIVLIGDGTVGYVQPFVDSCVEQGIQIYAVNVASAVAHEELQKMADVTGGQYYYGDTADSITGMLTRIQGDTVDRIDPTDTDGDGLYDIYETAGMKLPNGKIIYTDPDNTDTDGDGLSDYQETGLVYNVDDRYIGNEILARPKYFLLQSDPTSTDTDGDNILDGDDPHPWKQETVWVAELDNRFPDVEYLKVDEDGTHFRHAGNQGWWQAEAASQEELNYLDFATDKNYRIWKMGCGLIACSDVELYLLQQNTGYRTTLSPINDITYDEHTGIIQKTDYMSYVNDNADMIYSYGGGVLYYNTGLRPVNIEVGLERFLTLNDHDQKSATWAPYSIYGKEDEKRMVLDEIETMLNHNLPVVFNYYTPDKSNKLTLYASLQLAKDRRRDVKGNESCTSHYMTITGLYKYLEEDAVNYDYVLRIVSWGKTYYVRYDEYNENLYYFSNILKIY